jgi:hypothetical protein
MSAIINIANYIYDENKSDIKWNIAESGVKHHNATLHILY